jgi:uncharacterized short protein YbdD (DUF466 family)
MGALERIWRGLKQLTGEGDYARYCEHLRSRHPEGKIPTEREFYLDRLNEKYTRPSRCC